MMSKIRRISFKNRRFLSLIPSFLAKKTTVFSLKNHRFLNEKAWNYAVFSYCRFSKTWFYAMLTWQITIFGFLFRKKVRR